jgi:uncharacterized protein (DUF2062 family)
LRFVKAILWAAVILPVASCAMAPGLIGGALGYVASVNNIGVEYFKFREEESKCADSNSQPK